MAYEGYRISCGCSCRTCGTAVILECYEDADGTHYCPTCDDYVVVTRKEISTTSPHHPAQVRQRAARIASLRQSGQIK